MYRYDLLIINDFRSGIRYGHYKHVVVNCILPDIYFASSNIGICATQQQKWQQHRSIQSHYKYPVQPYMRMGSAFDVGVRKPDWLLFRSSGSGFECHLLDSKFSPWMNRQNTPKLPVLVPRGSVCPIIHLIGLPRSSRSSLARNRARWGESHYKYTVQP